MKKKLLNHFSNFITENRLELFDKIISYRTKYITVVLEDIYQPHNASAVLRSCDCFGIRDVHIIENRNKYSVNPDVALGSSKWLNMIKYNSSENNTPDAVNSLKEKGYRIVAVTPHKNGTLLNDYDLIKGKTALFFGTELTGLTKDVLENADEFLEIPMVGFTESLNISVCVAVILFHLSQKLRGSTLPWKLDKDEITDIKLNWMRNTIKRADLIEKEFLGRMQGQ